MWIRKENRKRDSLIKWGILRQKKPFLFQKERLEFFMRNSEDKLFKFDSSTSQIDSNFIDTEDVVHGVIHADINQVICARSRSTRRGLWSMKGQPFPLLLDTGRSAPVLWTIRFSGRSSIDWIICGIWKSARRRSGSPSRNRTRWRRSLPKPLTLPKPW